MYDNDFEIGNNDVDSRIVLTEANLCDNFNESDNNFQIIEFYKKGRYMYNITLKIIHITRHILIIIRNFTQICNKCNSCHWNSIKITIFMYNCTS